MHSPAEDQNQDEEKINNNFKIKIKINGAAAAAAAAVTKLSLFLKLIFFEVWSFLKKKTIFILSNWNGIWNDRAKMTFTFQ